jgi:hypothetical protein
MAKTRMPTDDELWEKACEMKRDLRARADRIKDQLCLWMAQNVTRRDAVAASMALVELGIDACLVKEQPSETLDYLTQTFHRLAHTRTGKQLQ